jgi:hypothetical protein
MTLLTFDNLSEEQQRIITAPCSGTTFLEGPAGSGKTTAGVLRLLHMLESGVRADRITILLPQRTLGSPYASVLRQPHVSASGQVTLTTLGGLARRMLALFWPLIAEEAGFGDPDSPPTFLTLETAQYYMAQVVRPYLDQDYFSNITLERNRLYSQILDNLNKAAVVGFPHTEIGDRMAASWIGDENQRRVYDEAQICASSFREMCYASNLLDFSLQVTVFLENLWPLPQVQRYLGARAQHLLVDNVEEDTPVSHDLLSTWLSSAESALVIYDSGGGYRRFLGADPHSAYALRQRCSKYVRFRDSFVTSPPVRALGARLMQAMDREAEVVPDDARDALSFEFHRYHPQMLGWVTDQIADLVHQHGTSPGEIAVLAPFMSDALRFSLSRLLERRDLPVRSHRPSRALREEPATRCLLTLARLAHPGWQISPGQPDVAHALMMAIEGMDLVRAHLLSKILYRKRDGLLTLESFTPLKMEVQERITFSLGERYERLRTWLEAYSSDEALPLDHFLARLFGEVLSQSGFRFHASHDDGAVAANLIESVRKFRWALGEPFPTRSGETGRVYVEMVQEGLVASQYVRSWEAQTVDAVLLAPAYTFLMGNRPVDYQFWLDVGGMGWWERLYQPLTHPYVLSRSWKIGDPWTDADETRTRNEALFVLTQGLIQRCRRGIFLGLSELGEGGFEQQGPLLRVIQKAIMAADERSGASRV